MYSYAALLTLVAPIYAIIVAGFAIRRLRWLTSEADASMLRVSVNVLAPCLILDSLIGNEALRHLENMALPPVMGLLTSCVGFLFAWMAAPLIGLREPRQRRTFSFVIGICNYGFIPIPIVMGLFDEATLGVLFNHNLGVEIALWTVGVLILTGAHGGGGWRRALNGPVLAVIAGTILNLSRGDQWLPGFLLQAVHLIGLASVPIALLLTGASLAEWGKTDAPAATRALLPVASCVLRLIALPLALLVITRNLPCSVELKRVLVIQAAMPCAVFPIVLTRHFGGDAAIAVAAVVSTSALGLLTIPAWIRFGLHFVGAN